MKNNWPDQNCPKYRFLGFNLTSFDWKLAKFRVFAFLQMFQNSIEKAGKTRLAWLFLIFCFWLLLSNKTSIPPQNCSKFLKNWLYMPDFCLKTWQNLIFLRKIQKNWVESSQNRGIVKKGALFFFHLTPGINFMDNFDTGKGLSYISCVFLSDI